VNRGNGRGRVLYSFPNRLGAGRICYTAWKQVAGLAAAGAEMLVLPTSLSRSLPHSVRVCKQSIPRRKNG
jgi:hypothetical protein